MDFLRFQLYRGDDWDFVVPDIDPGYTAVMTLLREGLDPISLVGPDGVFEIPASQTSAIPAATYQATVHVVTPEGKRKTLYRSELRILPDPSDPASDYRSQAEKALAEVEEALAAGAGSDVIEYEVGGTRVKKDRKGLLALRNHYLAIVRRERGIPAIQTITYRF